VRLPRSLRALTLIFVAAFLLVTAGTGVAIYAATHRAIERLVDQRIAGAADAVGGPPESGAAPLPTAELLRRLALLARERDTGDIGTVLIDGEGRRIGGNVTLRRPLPLGAVSLQARDGIKGLTAGRAFTRAVGGGRRLTLIAETEPFDDYWSARLRIYLIGFGSIVAVVAIGMLVFARLVGGRIGAMRTTVEAIVDGDMQRRVPTAGDGGTFDRQAEALNRMLDRIAELMQGISEVSSDIAHDLRSPLARLRARLVRIERGVDDVALRGDLASAIAQSDEILAMFGAVLRIAEVEGGARRAGFAEIDLADLGDEIATMMAPVAEESGHRIMIDALSPLPIRGDRQLLTQVLINLIENACRHTPAGTGIVMSGGVSGPMAMLTLTDEGPGIPAEERGLALRRFGRLDRSRSSAGHGLGLPLAAAILRLHRGELRLEDAAPGLRVVLVTPLR